MEIIGPNQGKILRDIVAGGRSTDVTVNVKAASNGGGGLGEKGDEILFFFCPDYDDFFLELMDGF